MAVAENDSSGSGLNQVRELKQLSLEQTFGHSAPPAPMHLNNVGIAAQQALMENLVIPEPALAVELTSKFCFCDARFQHVRDVKFHHKRGHSRVWQKLSERILKSCGGQRPKKPCEHCLRRFTSARTAHASVCPGLFQWRTVHSACTQGYVEDHRRANVGGLWRSTPHLESVSAGQCLGNSSGDLYGDSASCSRGRQQEGGGGKDEMAEGEEKGGYAKGRNSWNKSSQSKTWWDNKSNQDVDPNIGSHHGTSSPEAGGQVVTASCG